MTIQTVDRNILVMILRIVINLRLSCSRAADRQKFDFQNRQFDREFFIHSPFMCLFSKCL